LAKLAGLGIKETGMRDFFVPVSPAEKEYADELLRKAGSKKKIIINPGAKSHLKRWPAVKYAELSDRLITELGSSVFVTGNEDDIEVISSFKSSIKEKVEDISCRTTIGSLMALISGADLVITNDSAPLHIASAAGTPVIAIFGPSDEKKYGPLSGGSLVLKPDVSCRPCSKALCGKGPDEGCISGVKTEDVFQAAKKVLRSSAVDSC
jgi:ADP-heptose:LPS heptosyltransferase